MEPGKETQDLDPLYKLGLPGSATKTVQYLPYKSIGTPGLTS